MSRDFRLRPLSDLDNHTEEKSNLIDRRDFLRYSFNTAAGGITMACLGSIGFASLLMGQPEASGGDSAVRFWVPTGAEDTVWYGDSHLQPMSYDAFVQASANSNTGMTGAQGVWSGMPVNVIYVPDAENKNTATAANKPRFQYTDGYNSGGKYVGSGYEIYENQEYAALSIHDNLIIVFSRCPHLCCIPGWQLVTNDYTNDSWEAGGTESGGNKLFCICHSSRFDPTAIEKNSMGRGTPFQYIGIKRVGGPAPNGMPLVPFVLNGDMIEALPDFVDWYAYCS
jgi:Rieske Fe-S protein|tara:strand:+ start:94 stop:939 length:846 start_codon:yes stop_codon:yes gene_type:complete